MGLENMEAHHADPAHIEKIMQAAYGVAKARFPWPMLIIFAITGMIALGLVIVVSTIPGLDEPVYLRGEGVQAAMPLSLFTLIMAVSLMPHMLPVPFFLLAGILVTVPMISWLSGRIVFQTRRMFHKPVVAGLKLRHLRPV
jgi:hypothetical protein